VTRGCVPLSSWRVRVTNPAWQCEKGQPTRLRQRGPLIILIILIYSERIFVFFPAHSVAYHKGGIATFAQVKATQSLVLWCLRSFIEDLPEGPDGPSALTLGQVAATRTT